MLVRKINRIGYNRKKRVAAYCRVSTNYDSQEESFERQREYYAQFIQNNPDWEFAGIYADRGISGMSAAKRPEFMRMMRDATGREYEEDSDRHSASPIYADSQSRKIDIILVKSISRFSRNLVDCDRAVKALKAAGVEVRFERENINTSDPASGFAFSVFAAVAQEEVRSISENVRWRYAARFKNGDYGIGSNRIFGYDNVEGKLVPNDKAPIIRRIFELFTQGNGATEIARIMADEGVCGIRNGKRLSISSILYMLRNETYVGDKRLQKQAPLNYLTKRPDPNAKYESYYLENDHEAIIDRATWERTQELLKQKREEIDHGIYRMAGQHPLYGKLFCGNCGAPYKRQTLRECPARGGGQYKAWNCRERLLGRNGNGCKNRIVREIQLLEELSKKIGETITEENAGKVLEGIRRIDMFNDRLEVTMR